MNKPLIASLSLAVLLCAGVLLGQAPKVRLPDEAAGDEGIAKALIAAFDQVDVIGLGEAHLRKSDSDLRIALVRQPAFAKKVRFVVIECGSTTAQPILDRYIRGEDVPSSELATVWKTVAGNAQMCAAPIYTDFLAAIRDVNSKLPADGRIRVLGGDPGPGDNRSRETAASDVITEQVLAKHGKALVIYGAAHFYRSMPPSYLASAGSEIGLTNILEKDYPGRSLSVIVLGGHLAALRGVSGDVAPDNQKFERAVKTQVRPVLLSLQRSPFGEFTAEEFLGRTLIHCDRNTGCESVFRGSTLTLRHMADAAIYYGDDSVAAPKPPER